MGQIGGAAGVEDGAEDVGDECEGDQLVALGEHGGHDVEVDAAILGQRNYVDFCASAPGDELPGDDVAVMLQPREHDQIAGLEVSYPPAFADKAADFGPPAGA